MEEVKQEKTNKLAKGEIVWSVISGSIAIAGLTMVVFGIVGDYLPLKSSENWILLGEASFQNVMKMNYRWFGVILILFAALVSVIFLNYYAKKSDIDEERALRRQQRLQVISQSAEATPAPTSPAVDAKVTPVAEKKS
jgi:uncharacterized membrane protein YbaN (DUF454 family)